MKRGKDRISTRSTTATEPMTHQAIVEWLRAVLSITETAGAMVPNRWQLRDAFRRCLSFRPDSVALVLAFGSTARLEQNNDLDLIIVQSQDDRKHEYSRISLNDSSIDLNVVSLSWLDDAWKDVEHGYWLAESFPLFLRDDSLVSRWTRAANRYWSSASKAFRRDSHREATTLLAAASRLCYASGRRLVARWLSHEAARAFVCAILDRRGERVFSHRTLRGEFDAAVSSAGLTERLQQHIYDAMKWSWNRNNDFIALRARLSEMRRHPTFQALTKAHCSLPRLAQIRAICKSVEEQAGVEFDDWLLTEGADGWLPTLPHSEVDDSALDACVSSIISWIPARRKLAQQVFPVPQRGEIYGARWAEVNKQRLKLIINTGGCKTASCSFCDLPKYGRSQPIISVVSTVAEALDRYKPQELALYNDGNFLNDSEVSPELRSKIWQIVRPHKLKRLTIETVPRFVTRARVAEVLAQSEVEQLTICLGLQCTGNSFAVGHLGRPDVDAIFDFAIEEISAAGAQVRLYLLYGFGQSKHEWDYRVVSSLAWASARSVARVSICPYVGPDSARISTDFVDSLDSLLSEQAFGKMQVEIVDRGMASCVPPAKGLC